MTLTLDSCASWLDDSGGLDYDTHLDMAVAFAGALKLCVTLSARGTLPLRVSGCDVELQLDRVVQLPHGVFEDIVASRLQGGADEGKAAAVEERGAAAGGEARGEAAGGEGAGRSPRGSLTVAHPVGSPHANLNNR